MSIFIVDCDRILYLYRCSVAERSNPCPFLLWIATLAIRNKRKEKTRSNPCPFLLWIATAFTGSFTLAVISCSNPCPFLLWIATVWYSQMLLLFQGSNPCPFLLWIATERISIISHTYYQVVTLVHFYCGLRRPIFCVG